MTNLEMVKKVANNIEEGHLHSKVSGNRNWVICLRNLNGKRYVWTASRFGNAGRMCDSFADILNYNIKYFFFTYKKDFVKMLRALNESGNYNFLAGCREFL